MLLLSYDIIRELNIKSEFTFISNEIKLKSYGLPLSIFGENIYFRLRFGLVK